MNIINLPTELLEVKQTDRTLILRLSDDKLVKWEASTDCGGCPEICEADVTLGDKFMFGLITKEQWNEELRKGIKKRKDAEVDACLFGAWQNFNMHGDKAGFRRPSKFPEEVEKIYLDIDWSKSKATRKMITYNDVVFIVYPLDTAAPTKKE